MNNLLLILALILVLYASVVAWVYFNQRTLLYRPEKVMFEKPTDYGLRYEDVLLNTGLHSIHGWYIPARNARATMLYCHGNAHNISGRTETIQLLNSMGINLLIFDYSGYGKSDGQPTEKNIYNDVVTAWNYLTEEREIPSREIIIMGRSLGGGPASWLARKVDAAGLILEATFTSMTALAGRSYPFLPVKFLLKDTFPVKFYLRDIKLPVLIAHSTQDEIISFSMGEELYEAAHEPKTFLKMEGRHADAFLETGEKYINTLDQFIESVLKK